MAIEKHWMGNFLFLDETDSKGRCVRQTLVKYDDDRKVGKPVSIYAFSYHGDSSLPFMMTLIGSDLKPKEITHFNGEKPARIDELNENRQIFRQKFPEYQGYRLVRTRILDLTNQTETVEEEPVQAEPPKISREGQYGLDLEETDPLRDGIHKMVKIAKGNAARLRAIEEHKEAIVNESYNNSRLEERPSSPET